MDKPTIKAPGLKFRPRKGSWAAYWVPSPEAVRAGYPSGTVPLTQFVITPQLLVDACNRLQGDMLAWLDGMRRDPLAFDGTIGSVLRIYQKHEDSPFHSLKPGSRKPYVIYLRKLEQEVGDQRIEGLTGLQVKRWHTRWAEEGTRPAAAQMRIAVLKVALTFCIVAGYRSCRPLRDDIAELRLPTTRPRSLVATADQVRQAIAAAHAIGRPSLALCYAVQFETALRQWDAAGQWYPIEDPAICPVVHGRQKWAGLEWRHIGEDLVLRYVPSKTREKTGVEVVIDLRLCPMVLDELARMPSDARSGPLIVNEVTGLPYTDPQFNWAWKKVRKRAGLPDELWSRDLRASAVTEGRGGGALTDDAAKVAGHTRPRTTADIYDRERLEAHRRFAVARLGRRAPKSEG